MRNITRPFIQLAIATLACVVTIVVVILVLLMYPIAYPLIVIARLTGNADLLEEALDVANPPLTDEDDTDGV